MEQKTTGSPLSRICYQDSTFMLEALLPFVPVNLKLPLAIMIKWNEFQRMLSVFQSSELLSRYGLAEQEFTIQGLTSQLAGCPNPKLSESIGQMMQMMQMMQTMQAMQNMESSMSDKTTENDIISDILSQYNASEPASASAEKSENMVTPEAETKTNDMSSPNATPPESSGSFEDPLEEFDIDQFVKEIFS